jgi:hypothetical protein
MKEWVYSCRDPRFLDLGTSWKWAVSFTLRSLYPRYPLDRRLDGSQSQSGRYGEEKMFHLTETRTATPSVVQLVASHYTDCANVALTLHQVSIINIPYLPRTFTGRNEFRNMWLYTDSLYFSLWCCVFSSCRHMRLINSSVLYSLLLARFFPSQDVSSQNQNVCY